MQSTPFKKSNPLLQMGGVISNDEEEITKKNGRERVCKEERYLQTIKKAPRVGFEPTTKWLTATYSTAELSRNIKILYTEKRYL